MFPKHARHGHVVLSDWIECPLKSKPTGYYSAKFSNTLHFLLKLFSVPSVLVVPHASLMWLQQMHWCNATISPAGSSVLSQEQRNCIYMAEQIVLLACGNLRCCVCSNQFMQKLLRKGKIAVYFRQEGCVVSPILTIFLLACGTSVPLNIN